MPFSSQNGSGESLITVYCSGKGFKGEGRVDVTLQEGDIENYLLKIVDMLNIALAASNIPDDLKRNSCCRIKIVDKKYPGSIIQPNA